MENGNSNTSFLGKNIYSISGLVIAAVLIVVINLFSNLIFSSVRLDLTEGNIYSLSDGTKNIIDKIDEPITLRYYFSSKLLGDIPSVSNYGKRVKELLVEYEKISAGNIKLIIVDPEPFSEQEDQAVQYGIQALPLGDGRTKAYFGLIGSNATDKEAVIAFFQAEKEDSLEYDITKLVNQLSDNKKKVVGLMTSLPMVGGAPSNPMMPQAAAGEWYILTQLKQLFEVQTLETSVEKIPDNIDVLLMAHAKSLSEKTQFAIDQFVLKGGHLLVFVDPFSEADAPPAAAQQNPQMAMNAVRDSNLDKLFKAWGIELSAGKIVADRLAATRVGVNTGQGAVQAVEYIAWLTLQADNFNTDDFVTNSLKTVTMGSAGHFNILEAAKDSPEAKFNKTITPLIQTSKTAMELEQMQFRFGVNPIGLLQKFVSADKKFNIAVRINGLSQSAFPDGIEGQTDSIKQSTQPINVIAVADTDMLEDKFWVNIQNFLGQKMAMPRANNDAFLINAIDNLSGSNDLISLRTRGRSSKPFTTVVALKREAEQKFQAKEKALQTKLNQAEQKLNALQQQKQGQNAAILSLEQRKEIEDFRAQQVSTRKELRAVQHELGKSIEQLGTTLRFINIALIPLLIAVFAIFMGVRRSRRTPVLVTAK
ncbi:gliding motility protein GldG [hydrothermal vent metagenome]|uniref:Gliding motility protein GldG n=1 Tax=hydrothermal vent metagenome TaxID=652676 RepID=A0A3B1ADE5_9ZZZZ